MIPRDLHSLSDFLWFVDNARRRYRLIVDEDDNYTPAGDPSAVRVIHRDGSPAVVAPFDPHTFEDTDTHAEDLLVQSLRETARLVGGLGR